MPKNLVFGQAVGGENCKKSEAMSAVIQQMWLLLTLGVQVLKY